MESPAPRSPGSPSSTASDSAPEALPALPLAPFCGQWLEVPAEGESLEPILRKLGLSEKKIEATLRGGTKQDIRLRGWELFLCYESELGKATDRHVVNGGRRALANNNGLTECKFEPEKPFPLRIASVLPAGRGTMRDKRSVRGPRMEQVLEFFPDKEETPITVRRVWTRVPDDLDKVVRKLTGQWIIDETRSESVRGLLEASMYPKGAIEAAQELLHSTVHTILLSAHGEATLSNTVAGRTSTVSHALCAQVPANPQPGKSYCCVSNMALVIVSVSKLDGAMHTDERTVSSDGMEFEQRLSYVKGDVKVTCTRWWKRVSGQVFLEEEDSQSLTSIPVISAASPQKPSTVQPLPPLAQQSPQPQQPTTVVNNTDANAASLLPPPIAKRAQVSVPDPSNASSPVPSEAAAPSLSWPRDAWLALPVLALIASLSGAVWPLIPIYLGFRAMAPEALPPPVESPEKTWAETALVLVVLSLVAVPSSRGGESPPSELIVFAMLCVFGAFRLRAPSAWIPRSKSDQWLVVYAAMASASLIAWVALSGTGEEGSLGIASFAVLVAVLSRRSAAFPPLAVSSDDSNQAKLEKKSKVGPFEIAVTESRISGDFAEYKVVCKCKGEEYSAWRRYSAFRKFRHLVTTSAPLPPKRLLFNLSPAVLEERRSGLDFFLKDVFAVEPEKMIETMHEVRAFVGAPAVAMT